MNQVTKYSLIIFGLLFLFSTMFIFSDGLSFSKEIFAAYGIAFVISTPITFLLGIILVFIKSTREFGLASLIVCAISLLVGLGLCSMGNFNL